MLHFCIALCYTLGLQNTDDIINSIRSTARFGIIYAENKYNAIIQAANNAKAFGHSVSSNFKRIHLYTRFIRQYDEEVSSILSNMHELVNAYKDTEFVKQIHLIESFKGAGFLSAVSLTIIAVALIVLCFAVCFINLRLLMLG